MHLELFANRTDDEEAERTDQIHSDWCPEEPVWKEPKPWECLLRITVFSGFFLREKKKKRVSSEKSTSVLSAQRYLSFLYSQMKRTLSFHRVLLLRLETFLPRLLVSIIVHLVARVRRSNRLHVDVILIDAVDQFSCHHGIIEILSDKNRRAIRRKRRARCVRHGIDQTRNSSNELCSGM